VIAKLFIKLFKPIVECFPRLASFWRNLRDQLDLVKRPKITPWGFKLAGNATMAQGTFEPIETSFVRNTLKNIDILVNVGANIGYYCCHALSMGKSVIAFEPIPRNLSYLCKNIKNNNWACAEIYPIALSNDVGVIEIYGGNTGASLVRGWANTPESYSSLVPCSTMDIVLGTRLRGQRALILIDVEGAEKWVLEGANLMITNDPKPIWLVEIVAKDHQPSGIDMNPHFMSTFELFFQNGYDAFIVDQEMQPITIEDIELISKGSLELGTYNFLFQESNNR